MQNSNANNFDCCGVGGEDETRGFYNALRYSSRFPEIVEDCLMKCRIVCNY